MVCTWTINMKEDIKTRNILSTIRNIQEGTYSEKNLIVEDTNDEVDDNVVSGPRNPAPTPISHPRVHIARQRNRQSGECSPSG